MAIITLVFMPGLARAGYPVQPFDGATVAGQPTFLVYVDADETLASVDVASNSDMTGLQMEKGRLFGHVRQHVLLRPEATMPLRVNVAAPTAPTNAGLVSPGDGAAVSSPTTFTVQAPPGASVEIDVSDSRERFDDGSAVLSLFSCDGNVAGNGRYACTDDDTLLASGLTYYWWAVIRADGNGWIYGPRQFSLRTSRGRPIVTTGARPVVAARDMAFAPQLHSSARFTGSSTKQSLLSDAAYALSKYIRIPKTVAVACWSDKDWASVSGDTGDGYYSTLGLFSNSMPRWIQLSPQVCRAIETLLHNRPRYPNRFTSNAVETLTHEEMHALGISNEAEAECFGMQLSVILATRLGVPYTYADRLVKLNLTNYRSRPARYRDWKRCRENGIWDVSPQHPSPPWHTYK